MLPEPAPANWYPGPLGGSPSPFHRDGRDGGLWGQVCPFGSSRGEGRCPLTHRVSVDPQATVSEPGAVGQAAQATEDAAVPLALPRGGVRFGGLDAPHTLWQSKSSWGRRCWLCPAGRLAPYRTPSEAQLPCGATGQCEPVQRLGQAAARQVRQGLGGRRSESTAQAALAPTAGRETERW